MKTYPSFHVVLALAALAITPCRGESSSTDANQTPAETVILTQNATQDDRWEMDIRAFEEQDKQTPAPADATLFIGSSSIRRWSTLARDLSEIPVINRGFGGSEIADSTRYIDRTVLPYKPRLIVMFAGGNDLERGKTPAQVSADFQAFVTRVRAGLPNVTIAYISTNPTLKRWKDRDKTIEANRLIAEYINGKPKLAYIDSYGGLLNADGVPQKSLLREDGLHLNEAGYEAWTGLVKPSILQLYKDARFQS